MARKQKKMIKKKEPTAENYVRYFQQYQPVLERMIDQEKSKKYREEMQAVLTAIVEYCSCKGMPDHLTAAFCKTQMCEWVKNRLPTPPEVKEVVLKKEDGKFIATWTRPEWPCLLRYCLRCTQSDSEEDEKEFNGILETSYELFNANSHKKSIVSPTKYYMVTVWAVDTKRRKGEKKQSEKGMLYELHGGIYLNATSSLSGSSKVFNGYMTFASGNLYPVAVKVGKMAQIKDEEEILWTLTNSSNIVTYRISANITDTHGGCYCIAMELCCTDIDTGMVMHAKHEMQWYKMVIIQIMSGVADIHEAGYVHGDLKQLQNILLSLNRKKINIAGFGKSRKSEDTKGDILDAAHVLICVLSYSTHVCESDACSWKPSIIESRDVDLSILTCDDVEIAKDMISKMRQEEPGKRPTAMEVLAHPFFWDDGTRLNFLCHMSDSFKPAMFDENTAPQRLTKIIMTDFQTKLGEPNWLKKMEETPGVSASYLRVLEAAKEQVRPKTGRRDGPPVPKYDHKSVFRLLRFIRNITAHYQDYQEEFKEKRSNVWKFFYKCFPTLLCSLYDSVYKHFLEIEKAKMNDTALFFTELVHCKYLP